MEPLHQEILAFLLLTCELTGGCTSATFRPKSLPIQTIAPTATAASAPVPFGVTSLPSQPDYLDEIYMMDGTSGWAWVTNQRYERLLFRTSDGGRTWMDIRLPDSGPPPSQPYLIYPLDARTAWVIIDDRLVRTTDGGQTWVTVNPDLEHELVWPYRDWYLLHFADADHGWLDAGYAAAGAHEFYYETRDGGLTWSPMDFESWPAELNTQRDYKNEIAFWVAIDTIYYDSMRFIIAPGEQEGTLKMFLSTDQGKVWKNVWLLPPAFPRQSFSASDRKISEPTFFDPREGVVTVTILDRNTNTTQLLVYGTLDGGLTWSLSGGPSLIHDLHSKVSFLSLQDGVLICGFRFCVTHDSGKTWQAFDFGAPLPTDHVDTYYQLSFVGPTLGWLLEKSFIYQSDWPNVRLFKTNDGGLTWTRLSATINP